MTDESDVALSFNDCINARDVIGLATLMTDDHTFVDSEESTTVGKVACVEAWRGFFVEFPDYQNIFDSTSSAGELVTIIGRSECSEPALAGPALWTAVVRDGLISRWQVYDDTPETRSALGLSTA